MAKSIIYYTGDGTTTTYPVTFDLGFIRRDHVIVADELGPLNFTWLSDTQIELAAPPMPGEQFYIKRVTPQDELVNDYTDKAILRGKNLNDSLLQTLMILEELEDAEGNNIMRQDLDMNGNRVLNLPDALTNNEPVNKGQLDYEIGLLAETIEALSPSGYSTANNVVYTDSNGDVRTVAEVLDSNAGLTYIAKIAVHDIDTLNLSVYEYARFGGSLFKKNNSAGWSVSDGGTHFLDLVGNKWERLFSGPALLEWWGIVEDEDNSSKYQAALDAYIEVHVPEGNYPGSFTINNTGAKLKGAGKQKTFCPAPDSASIGVGISALHVEIEGIDFSPSSTFSGVVIATQIVGGSGSRYITFRDVKAEQLSQTAECMVDIRTINAFAGYITFDRCQIKGGQTTLRGRDGGLISDLEVRGGTISQGGYFTIDLEAAEGVTFSNVEINGGGDLLSTSLPQRYDSGGGMRLINCQRVIKVGGWNENHIDSYKGAYNPNFAYCDEDCADIQLFNVRESRELTYGGFVFYPADMAMNLGISLSSTASSGVLPRKSGNMLTNPLLYVEGGLVDGWTLGSDLTISVEEEDIGFASRYTKIVSATASGRSLYQTIAEAASVDLARLRLNGRVSFSIVFRIPYAVAGVNDGLPAGGIRFGIATNGTSAGAWGTNGLYRAGGREGFYNEWIYAHIPLDVKDRTDPIIPLVALVADGAEIHIAAMSFGPGNAAYGF